ncbi:RNA-guided endonuclease TnpB family protein [Oscillatoria sp. FACHB-1406]|uniref:RNA-guided endonuclease InsQ/TnpB family protein n=1 Tax=Oscillatoria sp. FACHB-1406 TaxID=2692846 RepID=UPI0016824475|nr:RNA-guided endonuclease TnpB family protein [Oscillatoria sp. FACHB-1406]MBD2580055.1 transposase [Oscillatoria sp. FACHB-1406]
MLILSYQYKLDPTAEQSATLDEWLNVCRSVYNFALRERKDWVNSRKCLIDRCELRSEYIIPADSKRPTYASQCKSLTQAKQTNPNLKVPQSQVLQQTLKQVETAFVNMWERGFGFPRFKKAMRSFVFPQIKSDAVEKDEIDLPKIGKVKFHNSRDIPDGFTCKQIRVIKKASGYYVSVSIGCDVDVPAISPHGYAIGIDLGLNDFIATSENELIKGHRFFERFEGELKLLQRRLKNKTKGSRRWLKIKRQIGLLHEKIHNCRKDFFFKLAHRLCDGVGMIFAEDLNLKALGRSALRKACLDAAWGSFLNILSHVCWKRGVYFAKVDARETSQVCPNCGTNCGKKPLAQRVHHCDSCGYTTNRDVAAAQVVKERGLNAVGRIALTLVEGKDIGVGVYAPSRISL